MSENQRLDYYELGDALARAQISVDAADCHGLLAGLVCATGFADPKTWVAQVFEAYDPKDRLQVEAFRQLQALYENTLLRINSHDLDFELLLPDDEDPLRDRTEALGSWCSGFLTGLGLGGLGDQSGLPEEVTELLDDMAQIARVDFDLEVPEEEDLAAFEEVVEYVRVGALYINEELRPVANAQAPSQLQ
jgi:uncharacterized protein YgfB (UPF0149 family)